MRQMDRDRESAGVDELNQAVRETIIHIHELNHGETSLSFDHSLESLR
jgi:hypothetical protein